MRCGRICRTLRYRLAVSVFAVVEYRHNDSQQLTIIASSAKLTNTITTAVGEGMHILSAKFEKYGCGRLVNIARVVAVMVAKQELPIIVVL